MSAIQARHWRERSWRIGAHLRRSNAQIALAWATAHGHSVESHALVGRAGVNFVSLVGPIGARWTLFASGYRQSARLTGGSERDDSTLHRPG